MTRLLAIFPAMALLLGAADAHGPPLPPGLAEAMIVATTPIEPPMREDGLFHAPLATRYPERVRPLTGRTGREFTFGRLWDEPAEVHFQESFGWEWMTFGKSTNTSGYLVVRHEPKERLPGLMVRVLVYPPRLPPSAPCAADPQPESAVVTSDANP
jgi:hypothetical protein